VAPLRTLVFFDASVLVAASKSPSGGSSLAITICTGQRFRAAVSARVVLESRMNIAEKFGEDELLRFYLLMAQMDPEEVAPSAAGRLADCASLVGESDAHVLACALECSAGCILSLDRRHLVTPAVSSSGLPLKVVTPGDFLREIVSR